METLEFVFILAAFLLNFFSLISIYVRIVERLTRIETELGFLLGSPSVKKFPRANP